MKFIKLIIIYFVTTSILFLNSCTPTNKPTTFNFPEPLSNAKEVELISPWSNLPNELNIGNTRECKMYSIPTPTPSWYDFLNHYETELAKQGWKGKPTKTDFEVMNAYWLNKESNAGVLVIYVPKLYGAIVCVGNP